MATDYTFGRFTKDTFSATKLEWEAKAGSEEFASEYALVFELAESKQDYDRRLGPGESDQCFYGVFQSDQQVASAMVDIVNSQKAAGSMTKLMKIYLTPEYWNVEEHHHQIVEVYKAAILGCIEATKGRLLKLYGRSGSLLKLLQDLDELLNKHKEKVPGLSVSMKGRWLVLEV